MCFAQRCHEHLCSSQAEGITWAEVTQSFPAPWVTPAPISLDHSPGGKILLNAWQGPLCVLDYGNRDDKKRGNPWVSVLSTGLPFPGRRSLHTGTTLHSGSGGVCAGTAGNILFKSHVCLSHASKEKAKYILLRTWSRNPFQTFISFRNPFHWLRHEQVWIGFIFLLV